MTSRFIVHHHRTRKPHFDLRLMQDGRMRSWSLLKEPPCLAGEQRLAIERESLPPEEVKRTVLEEQAFGAGRVSIWDEGEVDIASIYAERIDLAFRGKKLAGNYEMRRMHWYPGNRWLLKKSKIKKGILA